MKPILYSYYRSSCSYRVRIALNLKGVDYEYRPVHLVKEGGEQYKSDFLNLNPKSEVPFFIHDKVKLSQSLAIIEYIDKAFPGVSLFPKVPVDYCRCLEIAEMIGSGIQPIQNLKVMNYVVEKFQTGPSQKAVWGHHWIKEGFLALEKKLKMTAGKYCLGDELTCADLFLIPQVYNAKRFNVDMSDMPYISQINNNCLKLETFLKAAPENQIDAC